MITEHLRFVFDRHRIGVTGLAQTVGEIGEVDIALSERREFKVRKSAASVLQMHMDDQVAELVDDAARIFALDLKMAWVISSP